MAQAVWRGSISFGMVNVPVSLHPAEATKDLSFEMLDKNNKAKIKYQRLNEATGQVVPWDDIVKGYKLSSGEYVLVNDEDFQKASVKATQTVSIEGFIPRGAVNYIYLEKPYYLVPDKHGEKAYVLLRETMATSNLVAIARVVIRSREHLALVIPEAKVLVLDLLRWHDELRSTDDLLVPKEDLKEYRVTDVELKMAKQLVESMVMEWQPENFKDKYKSKLLSFIEQKARMGEAVGPQEQVERPQVVDLMDALRRSIENAKQPGAPKPGNVSKMQDQKEKTAKAL